MDGHAFTDREGDREICPDPGRPRIVEGEVQAVARRESVVVASSAAGGDEAQGAASGCLSRLVWVCLVVAVLWLITVSAPLLANALTLEGWRFWCSLTLAFLPAICVLGVVFYALAVFRRLPRVEQFSEAEFEGDPDGLQSRLMIRYLAKFPEPVKYAIDNGFVEKGADADDSQVVDSLRRLKGELPACHSGSDGWLRLFREFQTLQDERAGRIIARTWKLVAVKTAASPWKVVDMLAVVYNSTVMVARLARLYNRRTSRGAAFRLACRWLINICIAGEMGDATQGAVEWADANDLISSTYRPLAGVVGKVAEGGANAFLVYRLGRRAMAYFRPLA